MILPSDDINAQTWPGSMTDPLPGEDLLAGWLKARHTQLPPVILNPEWPEVIQTATRHRIVELVYDSIQAHPDVPAVVRQHLRDTYQQTACRNLFLMYELGQCLASLQANNLDVIVLKGASLLATAYRTIGLRPMVDIDLLVRREQVRDVIRHLEGQGFVKNVEPRPGLTLEFENEVSLNKSGLEQVRIDLHWSLFDSHFYQRHLSMDWFWRSTVTTQFNQESMMVLGPEAQLLHLCGHLAFHHAHYPQLLWMNDLAEMINANSSAIDWDLLLNNAAEMALVLPLRTYLPNLFYKWDIPIPEEVVMRLSTLPVSRAEKRIFQWHTAKEEKSLISRIIPDLFELPPGKEQLRFIWAKLIPSPEYMRMRYRPTRNGYLPFLYGYHILLGMAAATLGLLIRWYDELKEGLGSKNRGEHIL